MSHESCSWVMSGKNFYYHELQKSWVLKWRKMFSFSMSWFSEKYFRKVNCKWERENASFSCQSIRIGFVLVHRSLDVHLNFSLLGIQSGLRRTSTSSPSWIFYGRELGLQLSGTARTSTYWGTIRDPRTVKNLKKSVIFWISDCTDIISSRFKWRNLSYWNGFRDPRTDTVPLQWLETNCWTCQLCWWINSNIWNN